MEQQNFFSKADLSGIDPLAFQQSLEEANQKMKQQEFNQRMPYVGEIVTFYPNPDDTVSRSNGAPFCAAIVTRVWSSVCVNIKIIPDHGPMQDRGSVSHKSANPAGYHFEFLSGNIDPRDVVFK